MSAPVLISRKQLLARVPFSHERIRQLEKAGQFPKRLKIGEKRAAWLESEVEAWIAAKIAKRDSKAA